VASLKKRMTNAPRVIVAPADGHVMKIIRDIDSANCRPLEVCLYDKRCSFCELTPFIQDGSSLVIIFMKLYHKHITLSPLAGLVRQTHYVPGGFRNVFLHEAYSENEHNSIVIDGDVTVAVIQIAGLVARKIVCDVSAGDYVTQGDKLGHIKFGSAVAVLLPPECKLLVKEGDKVNPGSSIIATY
jgi:phosphatidylserine decarboxylase